MEEIIVFNYKRYLHLFETGKIKSISLPEYIDIHNNDIDTKVILNDSSRLLLVYPHFINDTTLEYRYRIADRFNERDMTLFNAIREYLKYGGVANVENETFEVYIPFNTTYVGCVKHKGYKYDMLGIAFDLDGDTIFVGASQSPNGFKRYSGYINNDGA